MFIETLLIILIYAIADSTVVSEGRIKAWDYEIESSIKSNFHDSKCAIQFSTQDYMDPARLLLANRTITIRKVYPSEREIHYLQNLPESLSVADARVPDFAAKRTYSYDQWASEKNLRWEVPDNHPGQNRENCISMTKLSSEGLPVSLYHEFRQIDRAYYVIYIKNGFVYPAGSVGSNCGYYQGVEGCETRWDRGRDWYDACKKAMKVYEKEETKLQHLQSPITARMAKKPKQVVDSIPEYDWGIFWDLTNQNKNQENEEILISETSNDQIKSKETRSHEQQLWRACMKFSESDTIYGGKLLLSNKTRLEDQRPSRVNTVVVIPALWDYNYHHFMADSFARMVYLLPLLRRRTDIYIHIRGFEKYDGMFYDDAGYIQRAQEMRDRLFQFFGIEPRRILSGPVLAKTVIVPRPTRCSYALSNPFELLKLRTMIINLTFKKLKEENVTEHRQRLQHLLYLTQGVFSDGKARHKPGAHAVHHSNKQQHAAKQHEEIQPGEKRYLLDAKSEKDVGNLPTATNQERFLVQKRVGKKQPKHDQSTSPKKMVKVKTTSPKPLSREEMSQLMKEPVYLLTDRLPSKQEVMAIEEQEDGEVHHKRDTNHDEDDDNNNNEGQLTNSRSSSAPPSSPSSVTISTTNTKTHHHHQQQQQYTPPRVKTLLLMQRYTAYVSTDRDWSDKTTDILQRALEQAFPTHNVIRISSKPAAGVCLHCDWKHWFTADIVVAAHGAGLTNILLLPPHALVAEIAGEIKDVNLPVCGYYGPLSSLVGAHHYLYAHDMTPPFQHPNPKEQSNGDFALPVADFVQKLQKVYQTIQAYRQLTQSTQPIQQTSATVVTDTLSQTPQISVSVLTKGKLPASSVAYRSSVWPRISMVKYASATNHEQFMTILRVYNATGGPIAARP